ncbi:MAG: hypothetical protein ABIK39_06630 [candidate division WOR-3 bacterium]
MKKVVIVITPMLFVSLSFALLRAYSVEPVKAQWSGWTDTIRPYNYVSQTITCNFDSLVYCEFFNGKGSEAGIHVSVRTLGGYQVAWGDTNDNGDHKWLRCYLHTTAPESIIRGRRYEFRFMRSGQDSIQFYYDKNNPYPYGEFNAPNASFPEDTVMFATTDLCMRVYGKMNIVDSTWWGMLIGPLDTIKAHNNNLHIKAESAGVRMDRVDLFWDWVQPESTSPFDFRRLDPAIVYSHNTMHCKVIGILDYCAPWASTRNDKSGGCPPLNLFRGVWNPSNYWARYVEAVVRHYYSDLGLVDIYEVWNEPNDTGRFWRVPDFHYHISDTVHDLCSLYAQLCEVATTVIDSVTNGQATVLIGSLVSLQPSVPKRIPPAEMLRYCYRLADKELWDGVSTHPYQDSGFNLDLFEKQAETLRMVMRENGDYGKLWITEIGWSSTEHGKERQANWLCEAFVTAKGSEALPAGGYDQVCYYSFLDRDGEDCGVLDTLYQPKPSFYASCQTSKMIIGKRFNGRIVLGDARDDSVRIYEFENQSDGKRIWVCWQNDKVSNGNAPLEVKIPVRSDTINQTLLAYDNNPPTGIKPTGSDGWLEIELSPRPVFLTEVTNLFRPDLRVESVAVFPREPVQGQPMVLSAWIKNIGNRATPEGFSTLVVFTYKGVTLGQVVYDSVIQPYEVVSVNYSLPSVPDWMSGHCLITAIANPNQGYVELTGLDDNRGYKRVFISPFSPPEH